MSFYIKFVKRFIDIAISSLILIVFFPILIMIAAIIKVESRGPLFFIQERVGKDHKRFKIYKFRTMVNNAEKIGTGLKTSRNDPRITKVGKFLRTTSLDEIPQLLNIMKGDMSIIGPRPTIPEIVAQLSKEDLKRHTVRPGITGLAQINGRQSLNWSEKLKYDLEYVRKISLWLDLKIFFMTVLVVLKRDGVHKKDISNEYKNL